MGRLHLRWANADSPISRRAHGARHFKGDPYAFVERTGLFRLPSGADSQNPDPGIRVYTSLSPGSEKSKEGVDPCVCD